MLFAKILYCESQAFGVWMWTCKSTNHKSFAMGILRSEDTGRFVELSLWSRGRTSSQHVLQEGPEHYFPFHALSSKHGWVNPVAWPLFLEWRQLQFMLIIGPLNGHGKESETCLHMMGWPARNNANSGKGKGKRQDWCVRINRQTDRQTDRQMEGLLKHCKEVFQRTKK